MNSVSSRSQSIDRSHTTVRSQSLSVLPTSLVKRTKLHTPSTRATTPSTVRAIAASVSSTKKIVDVGEFPGNDQDDRMEDTTPNLDLEGHSELGDRNKKAGEFVINVDKDEVEVEEDSRRGDKIEANEGMVNDRLGNVRMAPQEEKGSRNEQAASPGIEVEVTDENTEGEINSTLPWDNGEALTEDERAHFLTLDAFSRTEEMKCRRRKRLDREAINSTMSMLNDNTL